MPKNEVQQIKFVQYTHEKQDINAATLIAGPCDGVVNKDSSQVSVDWARQTDIYYVNGIKIRQSNENPDGYTSNPQEFESHQHLIDFFSTVLLSHIEDPIQKEKLIEQCVKHLHQAGLPHVGNHGIQTKMLENFYKCIALNLPIIRTYGNPTTTVKFTAIPDGIAIAEEASYPKLVVDDSEVEEAANDKGYFVKVAVESKLTTDGAELLSVTCDCPDNRLKSILGIEYDATLDNEACDSFEESKSTLATMYGSIQDNVSYYASYLNPWPTRSTPQPSGSEKEEQQVTQATNSTFMDSVNQLSRSLLFWNSATNAHNPTSQTTLEPSETQNDAVIEQMTPEELEKEMEEFIILKELKAEEQNDVSSSPKPPSSHF